MTLKVKEIQRGEQKPEKEKERIQPGANSSLHLADDTQLTIKMKEVSKP